MFKLDWKRKLWVPDDVPEIGQRETLVDWVMDNDGTPDSKEPFVDMVRYGKLLAALPDKIVTNLENARLSRDGRMPMIKAGLGYEELLSAIIVDGTAITSSASEARLAPALLIPANYMQPGGIPGRNITAKARGRGSTIVTTAGTMIIRHRIAATDIITGTVLCATGAMAADAVAQTATMWEWDASIRNSVCNGQSWTRMALAEHWSFTGTFVCRISGFCYAIYCNMGYDRCSIFPVYRHVVAIDSVFDSVSSIQT